MARWAVRKRDGVWVALDHRGGLRYAADEWRKAVTFALLCGRPLPPVIVLTPGDLGTTPEGIERQGQEMHEAIRRLMRRWFREDGE